MKKAAPWFYCPAELEAGKSGRLSDEEARHAAGSRRLEPGDALTLFDGETLTEGPAILQHIADSAPETGLAPAAGSRDRTTLHARLNFVASELHRAFAPFFASEPPEGEAREKAVATLAKRFDHLEGLLEGRDHLVGERFTVADAYAFVVSSWAIPTKIGLDRWPNVRTFVDRIAKRPAAQAAMRAEGLIT